MGKAVDRLARPARARSSSTSSTPSRARSARTSRSSTRSRAPAARCSRPARRDGHGGTRVLGGDENLEPIDAQAAASNLPDEAGGVIRRFERRGRGPADARRGWSPSGSAGRCPGATSARRRADRLPRPPGHDPDGLLLDAAGRQGRPGAAARPRRRDRRDGADAARPARDAAGRRADVRPGGAGERDLDRAARAPARRRPAWLDAAG